MNEEADSSPEAEPERKPMPDFLRAIAETAIQKHRKRVWVPHVVPRPAQGPLADLSCPYREEDWELWAALLLECFGTRSFSVAQCFFRQLEALCPTVIYEGESKLRRDEEMLLQALAIVAGIKPRNELEAAAAAQYAALHITAMKLGANVSSGTGYVDSRSVASFAALMKAASRHYAMIQNGRSPKRAKQTFIVKKETHVHHHDERHVHLPGGDGNSGSRVHEADELRARARGAVEPQELPALPSPEQSAEVLRFPSGEGAESLPQARRGERIRRAEG